ncbi:hypothetical protein SISNIDRAFT_489551 [Sistotremastrum niveocremeum HHB9708]|uniref:F-box domain-containing protein n=1 Tax=Sistotremastrum niveocremeum HHB9708 TaxID=1314777 RepID=A0A164PX87_9AGAM|nr:hypothetical protein SISNIDRAFT_489551 [Sistotremastrum niveocremeum HHB9708]
MDAIGYPHVLRLRRLIHSATSPALPHDIQRLIAELAARNGKKRRIITLMSVSSSFAAWLRPILYESVQITKYLHVGSFVGEPSDEPSRFSMVKHLFISTEYDREFDWHVMNSCYRLQSLAIQGFSLPRYSPQTRRGFWSTAEAPCEPSFVMLFQTDCNLFEVYRLSTPVILRSCTHLAIEHTSVDIRSISYLLTIVPTVTHLALFYRYPRLFAVQHLGRFCEKNPQLSVIVLCQFLRRTRAAFDELWNNTTFGRHNFELVDPRVAFVEILGRKRGPVDYWRELTTGEIDVWALAKERMKARDIELSKGIERLYQYE